MSSLPLPFQALARLRSRAEGGHDDARALLHLIARADKGDQDVAKFLDHYSRFLDSYSKTIAALCRRLEALESAASTPPPAALANGLVERLRTAVRPSGGSLMDDEWRAVICEVAAWLDTCGRHGCSYLLREEIDQ